MTKPLVVITGASFGIDAITAKFFPQAGYPLALFARNLEALAALKLPNTFIASVDMTDFKALQLAIGNAEQKFGLIDYKIRFSNIAPAKIKTTMLTQAKIVDECVIEDKEVAKTLLWIYQRPQNVCIRDIVMAPTAFA